MPEQPPGREEIRYHREATIAVPSAHSESLMAIRRSDWERLKSRISRVANPPPRLSLLYSNLFGIAATAGFSVYPMATSQGLPAWVIPSYICVSVLLFAFGGVLVWLDRQNRVRTAADLSDAMQDMKEIEGSLKPGAE